MPAAEGEDGEMTYRKYKTDGESYAEVDSGCSVASNHISRMSSCLQCPFKECIYDNGVQGHPFMKGQRNEDIKKRYKNGEDTEKLATEFNLNRRYVERLIHHNGR